jgi:NAD(P)-dependent dehydrogenase (short-subunit alcohol dehydrogenase family)
MNILVFGAAGSIGNAACRALRGAGNYVFATANTTIRDGVTMCGDMIRSGVDVCSPRLREYVADRAPFDAVVYAVGHCPPNGAEEAATRPLSALPIEAYVNETRMHQIGALNVFQTMLPLLQDGGCMVFVTSAITRLKGVMPAGLHMHYHAGVIAAEDWLIEGMRADPRVVKHDIKIHRIAPGAADTPFHATGPRPAALLPVRLVVAAIATAIRWPTDVDTSLVQPANQD